MVKVTVNVKVTVKGVILHWSCSSLFHRCLEPVQG